MKLALEVVATVPDGKQKRVQVELTGVKAVSLADGELRIELAGPLAYGFAPSLEAFAYAVSAMVAGGVK